MQLHGSTFTKEKKILPPMYYTEYANRKPSTILYPYQLKPIHYSNNCTTNDSENQISKKKLTHSKLNRNDYMCVRVYIRKDTNLGGGGKWTWWRRRWRWRGETFAKERREEPLSASGDELGSGIHYEFGKPARVSEGGGRPIVRRRMSLPRRTLPELSSDSFIAALVGGGGPLRRH